MWKEVQAQAITKTTFSIHADEEKFSCGICGRRFTFLSARNQHLKSHSNEKPFPCEVCGKAFKQKRHLYLHLNRCHIEERSFPSDTCNKKFSGRAFSLRQELDQHQSVHIEKLVTPGTDVECNFI